MSKGAFEAAIHGVVYRFVIVQDALKTDAVVM